MTDAVAQLSRDFCAVAGLDAPAAPGWLRVTEVLRLTGFVSFGHIDADVLENARKRGVAVHKICQLEDMGDAEGMRTMLETSRFDLGGYLAAYVDFKRDTGWEWCACETLVRSARLKVEGHPDRAYWTGSALAIVDLKPRALDTAGIDCVKLQTAGYAIALAETMGFAAQAAPSFHRHALCLGPDGYKLTARFSDPMDIVHFGQAASLAHRIARRRT